MNWGLTHGMIGRSREALSPSLAAIGPNRYLGRADFLKMLGLAFAVHALIFFIASMFPHEKVVSIPVRALSFKLGDQDRIAAFGTPTGGHPSAAVSAPTMHASERIAARPMPAPAPVAAPKPAPAPIPVKAQKIAPSQPVVRQPPAETPQPTLAALPVPQPPVPSPPLPNFQPAPAIAPTPQQYVREVGQVAPAPQATGGTQGNPSGAIGGAGTESTQTQQTTEAVRQRYEQDISGWIERHKIYPAEAGGTQGRVVVRMRIDRAGTVRYYALEQSSGNAAIDAAAVDMIRRANPVPPAPANYPAGNLIEFLIPITFRAP